MAETFHRHDTSPEARASLLLCASFAQEAPDSPKPLGPREYARFVAWLQTLGLYPGDLLGADGLAALSHDDLPLAWPRLYSLLERTAALKQHLDGWAGKGGWIISYADADYPQRLVAQPRFAAPPVLYGIGDPGLLSLGGLAIVGSRHADIEALEYTRQVAWSCARQTIAVLSGGARGVDSAAMEAALQAGGQVIGIVADQLAKTATFPLYRDALRDGRLVLASPYNPDSGFHVGNAMGRNKYIYALADWGLVVHTALETGGTWGGAIEAIKHGRQVFVYTHGTDGNRALLERGASAFPDPWPRLAETLLERADTEHRQPTAYDLILPALLSLLEEPQDAQVVAGLLDVPQSQAQSWLRRALKERRIERSEEKEPIRYRRSRQQRMPFVAESDGGYATLIPEQE